LVIVLDIVITFFLVCWQLLPSQDMRAES
jgi:hypothetical protein